MTMRAMTTRALLVLVGGVHAVAALRAGFAKYGLHTHGISLRQTSSLVRPRMSACTTGRRGFLRRGIAGASAASGAMAAACGSWPLLPPPAIGLVKGSAPPPKKDRPQKLNCKSMDECQALGQAREEELFGVRDLDGGSKPQSTPRGDKFMDMVVGGGNEAREGSQVSIRYRVLRLGKRSRDELSGEGSPVFSFGYGEDDDLEGSTVDFVVGRGNLVPAIDDAIRGMREGAA